MDQALIELVEGLAVRALPAVDTHVVGDWLVLVSRGRVGRINSVTTLGRTAPDLAVAVDECEAVYRGRHRPVSFRLTPLDSRLDDLLQQRSYRQAPEVDVMTAPIPGRRTVASPATAVFPAWLERHRRFGDDDAERTAEIGESLRALRLPHGVFTMEEAAVGVAVVDRGWVGLFAIAVDPAERRRGLGRRLSQEMMAWGRARGAHRAWLQVHSENEGAADLYRSLGFATAYRYWYRRA